MSNFYHRSASVTLGLPKKTKSHFCWNVFTTMHFALDRWCLEPYLRRTSSHSVNIPLGSTELEFSEMRPLLVHSIHCPHCWNPSLPAASLAFFQANPSCRVAFVQISVSATASSHRQFLRGWGRCSINSINLHHFSFPQDGPLSSLNSFPFRYSQISYSVLWIVYSCVGAAWTGLELTAYE